MAAKLTIVQYTSAITNTDSTPLASAPIVRHTDRAGADLRPAQRQRQRQLRPHAERSARARISQALQIATAGSDILVDGSLVPSVYVEPKVLVIPAGVRLLGGYFTANSPFDSRDTFHMVTQIESSVTVSPAIDLTNADGAVVDGFAIDAQGLADQTGQSECVLASGASTISNDFITCHAQDVPTFSIVAKGGTQSLHRQQRRRWQRAPAPSKPAASTCKPVSPPSSTTRSTQVWAARNDFCRSH